MLIIVIMKVCRQDVSRFADTACVIRQERFEIRIFIYTRYLMFHPTTCILDIRVFHFVLPVYLRNIAKGFKPRVKVLNAN